MSAFTDKFDSLVIENFATDEECKQLIDIVEAGDKHGATIGAERVSDTSIRNNLTAYLDAPKSIRDKINKLLQSKGVKTDTYERVQVQIYEPGQYYKEHHDSWDENQLCKADGTSPKQRSWTCVLYLNEVDGGGGTYFPLVDKRVMPKKGQVACWNNLGPDGKTNQLTKHMGEDVTAGKKYLANFWYNTKSACAGKKKGGKRNRVVAVLVLAVLVVLSLFLYKR